MLSARPHHTIEALIYFPVFIFHLKTNMSCISPPPGRGPVLHASPSVPGLRLRSAGPDAPHPGLHTARTRSPRRANTDLCDLLLLKQLDGLHPRTARHTHTHPSPCHASQLDAGQKLQSCTSPRILLFVAAPNLEKRRLGPVWFFFVFFFVK